MESGGIGGRESAREAGLARRHLGHTAWNVGAIALPLLVGLAALPVLTRALGPARFGLLAIAWALLEYLAVLDFGLSRATLRLVAQRRDASHDPELGATVAASLAAQAALGALAGAAIALGAPFLVARLLDVPPALAGEAHRALLVLGATMPFVLLALALRALLEAVERFDLAAAVRAPASAATFVVPAIAAAAGATLPQILALLLAVRVAACAATWMLVRRAIPALRLRWPRELEGLRALAGVGGWIAVSSILTPVFLYSDRIIIGALGGVTAVGLYAGPSELALRMLVLPGAVAAAIFPAASAAFGAGRPGELERVYTGSALGLLLLLLPVVLVGVAWPEAVVRILLGAAYVEPGATVLRFLLPGVLLTSLAHLPVVLLQAAGRADVSGRLHLAMLAVHLALVVPLTHSHGVVGTAAAWSIRSVIETVVSAVLVARVLGLRPRAAPSLAAARAALRRRGAAEGAR